MMRDTVTIGGVGVIDIVHPRSFVAICDLVMMQREHADNSRTLARLCAAALGMCWGRDGDRPPAYELSSCDPMVYGADVLEWLLNNGMTRSDFPALYAEAAPLFSELWDSMPKEQEVVAEVERFQKAAD